jgi:hypothetical protein
MEKLSDNKPEHHLHVLTDQDLENLLIQIDSLYWALLNLGKQRAIKIDYDPHELSRQMNQT